MGYDQVQNCNFDIIYDDRVQPWRREYDNLYFAHASYSEESKMIILVSRTQRTIFVSHVKTITHADLTKFVLMTLMSNPTITCSLNNSGIILLQNYKTHFYVFYQRFSPHGKPPPNLKITNVALSQTQV